MSLFYEGNTVSRPHAQHKRDRTITIKSKTIQNMHPPKMPKQACAFLGLIGYYRKLIKNFAKIAKPLTLLTHQQVQFE